MPADADPAAMATMMGDQLSRATSGKFQIEGCSTAASGLASEESDPLDHSDGNPNCPVRCPILFQRQKLRCATSEVPSRCLFDSHARSVSALTIRAS